MGFLSGLAEAAGAAAPIAANVMAAKAAARAQAAKDERAQALQTLMLRMQQQKQDVADLVARSHAGLYDAQRNKILNPQMTPKDQSVIDLNRARTNAIEHPKPTAPVMGTPEWEKAYTVKKTIDQKYAPPQQPSMQVFPGMNGAPAQGVIVHGPGLGRTMDLPSVNKQAGAGSATQNAAMASKVNQFGEMLKKADDLFRASEGLDVGLGQSAAKDIAANGLGFKGLHIPGTQGVGSLLVNRTPQYSQYQAALDPFVLANAHALSGARINAEQAQMIKASIERKPGDLANPNVTAQKNKNIADQLNSVAGSLTPEQVAEMESQMSPDALERLRARGYLGHPGARSAGAPASAPKAPKGSSKGGFDAESFYHKYTSGTP